jgi:hypothetical protein
MLEELLESREILEGSGLTVEFGGGIFQDQTPGLTITELFGVFFAGANPCSAARATAAAGSGTEPQMERK